MTIIANLKTFTFAHNIIVMDGDKVLATTKASMKNVPEVISQLINDYKCGQVVLSGAKAYTKGIADKIKQCYQTKYTNSEVKLNVECI